MTGYRISLEGSDSPTAFVAYPISAVPEDEAAVLTYSTKEQKSSFYVENIDGYRLYVNNQTTGTLCIGVTAGGITSTYEIYVTVYPAT